LARATIERATAAGAPFSCVAAYNVYGVGDIEGAAPARAMCWTSKTTSRSIAWRRLSAGAGIKGERLHEWAYLELADLDGGLAFFSSWALHGTTIERLVMLAFAMMAVIRVRANARMFDDQPPVTRTTG
jgi:SRSO17 transposase